MDRTSESSVRRSAIRTVVVEEFLNELEVHPPGIYEQLTEAFCASAEKLFESHKCIESNCPACDGKERQDGFKKHNMTYWQCLNCATLFVSPRPDEDGQAWLQRDSPAAQFRFSPQYRESLGAYTRTVVAHRIEWLSNWMERTPPGKSIWIDIETRQRAFLTSLTKATRAEIRTVNPLIDPDPKTGSAAEFKPQKYEEIEAGTITWVSAFDALEHQSNPSQLIAAAERMLRPGGLFFLTTRSGSGFDIQVLWEHASIYPVIHLNLVTVEGMRCLLDRHGFETLESSTPGQLDVQLIERTAKRHPGIRISRFVAYFMKYRDKYAKRRLQQFLQENLLSSHLRIVARKRSNEQFQHQ